MSAGYMYSASFDPSPSCRRFRRRFSDPGRVTRYGRQRRALKFFEYDRKFWRQWQPKEAEEEEKEEKRKKKEDEDKRLPEKEAEKLKTLTVKDVDLHICENSKLHHTDKFAITKRKEKEPHAVLRRGQDFKVTVTFNRPYNKDKDDLVFIIYADKETPAPTKGLYVEFKLTEDGTTPYKKEGQWGATIVKEQGRKQKLELSVSIPGTAVVGQWELKVQTVLEGEGMKCEYEHDTPIIILFNPWSADDQVHFTEDKKLLNEYILNQSGAFIYGSSSCVNHDAWRYGQFEAGILKTCLSVLRKAFGFKMCGRMADPVTVSRALTMIVNSQDDNGVVVGNWSGSFEGGKNPCSWRSSVDILSQYEKEGVPVKYGQCWVFSHVLTTVCRALGLPCRSVTNFDSAHDVDCTCTIDHYFVKEGETLEEVKHGDSIWNFHVWNEVWMERPDCCKDYTGWQVIDATPQEKSHGTYQCGPCPVKAIKEGDVGVCFDAGFIFAEVNADVLHWILDEDRKPSSVSLVKKDRVGHCISTKEPNGLPYMCIDKPLDITREYKYPEGSKEERLSVRRALGRYASSTKLYEKTWELEVRFEEPGEIPLGTDIQLTSYVKNTSKEDKEVVTMMAVRMCRYWNISEGKKMLAKDKFPKKVIKAGREEKFTMNIPAKEYIANCDESKCMYGYVCATDVKKDLPYSDYVSFTVQMPKLTISENTKAKSGQPVTLKASFTNPCPIPLTQCQFKMYGSLKVADDDTNGFTFEPYFWPDIGTYTTKLKDLKPKEKLEISARVYGQLDEDDDDEDAGSEDNHVFSLTLECAELEAGISSQYFCMEISR